jgi:serine protease AprX
MRHRAAIDDRSNALWGRGSRGETRSNALWGRGGRRVGLLVSVVGALALASVATAGPGGSSGANARYDNLKSYLAPTLLSSIVQDPTQSFDVILQGDRKQSTPAFVRKLLADTSGQSDENVRASDLKQEFTSIDGAQLTLTGKQILRIAHSGLAESIVPNDSVAAQAVPLPVSNPQLWPWSTGAPVDWLNNSPNAATIAIVDSGIDATRTSDFGSKVLGQVNLASLGPNSPGDGYGHGTFVAGVAAGQAPGYAGAAPKAELLSIDVMNDNGQSTVADVVKACDFILANKAKYNIRVANFSLHAVNRASIMFDPLDQAVEKLWLNGIVVVTAAGNYGTAGSPSGVPFAPGNDPFVITVGATDIGTTTASSDDTVAPFSAYGYTPDGFEKPELGAPGRYMVGPVPVGARLMTLKPANVVDPVNGYMELSGTSFAAPVVSAAAATLIAQHPSWTPDQVKGALLLTAVPVPGAGKALGVGEISISAARAFKGNTIPNPNAGLNQFVETAPDGTRLFNASAWQAAALANKAWNAVAWSDVAWSDAAWSSVAWSDAAWASVAWASAAWGSAAWSDAAWSDAAWSDVAWADNAGDSGTGHDVDATPSEQDALLAQLGIVDPSCDPTIQSCTARAGSGSLLP